MTRPDSYKTREQSIRENHCAGTPLDVIILPHDIS